MSDGMLEAEVVNMQPSQLPPGPYRIRLFTGATATAVESAINTYLKGEEVSLAGFYMTHDGTARVVMVVGVPRRLIQSESEAQQWP